eukprot:CAMPEP_0198205188 /NCGR_PEP_ID=MMETSP1445-20131203/8681_1 /TAXON_ID=36898 /ORGANISM="Pyramimonas sp., Strain CCMP2087" /LENGTH=1441 /DNA_ID=CAMNT_0043877371 /DNA_START=94 /DNA_END=4415 /DNA_ORIENTATION=+
MSWRGVRYEEDPYGEPKGIHGTWHPAKARSGGGFLGASLGSTGEFPRISQQGGGLAQGKSHSLYSFPAQKEQYEMPLPSENKRKVKGASNVPKLPSLKTSPPTSLQSLTGTKRHSRSKDNIWDSPRGSDYGREGEKEKEKVSKPSDDPEMDLLQYIKTGDDVVEFYARNGKESEVKFFYCNRADTGIFFRPYDLEVVCREDAANEYFTLSASGVVHIKPGLRSDFTPLGEWMREKSIFNVLTRMKFFKYYLVYKTYRNWRSTVRQKLFSQVRNRLTRRLFLAKPTFCPSLMELYSNVYELSKVQLMSIIPNHQPYNLEEFSEVQITQRGHKAVPALEAVVERMQAVLEKICREVTKQARLYQESIRDESELEDKTGVNLYQGRPAEKKQSMVKIKEEKIRRAKTYRRVVEEAKMLGDFIRLADYMLVEGVVAKGIGTVEELLDLVEAPRRLTDTKLQKGVFLTTIAFNDQNMTFAPNEGDVLNVLNSNVIEGMIATMQQVPRLLLMRSFTHYFDGRMNGLNPVHIIRSTPRFITLRAAIDQVIIKDFEDAREYAQVFEPHRDIYDFGKMWNPTEYSAQKMDIRKYRQDMSKQRDWRTELDKMKTQNVLGTLHVDSKSLKLTLLPVTQRTLDTIKNLLMTSAREETLSALANFTHRVKLLMERPDQLDGFVSFQKMFTDLSSKKKAAFKEATLVDELYDLLNIYFGADAKLPTADQVKIDDLHEAVASYTQGISDADDFIKDRKQSNAATLEKNIATMNDELLAVLGTLHGGSFMEPDSDPFEVVTELEKIQTDVATMRQRSEQYQEYQKLFNMPMDDFGNLALVEKECANRYGVWKLLFDFETNSHAWTTNPVQSLTIANVLAEVDNAATSAYKMGKADKENRVVYRLKDTVDEFKQILPLIEELANQALSDRHWKVIFQLLGAAYDPEVPFSIKDLIDLNVMAQMEPIQQISTTASKEYSLEKAIDKMYSDWDGVEFRCVAYKDTGTFILGGTDDIQLLLDDQIVKIQSMRASPFIKPFAERASVWEDTLKTLEDMLDNWSTCQSTWQYLEPIFGSEDIMKQMPEEGQKFLAVDQIYRDMMTKANKNPGALIIARDKEALELLQDANVMLDEIQKGLAAYLEVKRISFPRFFFLSNDEMLEILSETKDPTKVQPHLKKCFEGINSLRFEPNTDINAMLSVEGEVVPFKTKVEPSKTGGAVEKWLVMVEAAMVEAIQDVVQKSFKAFAMTNREDWVIEWPGQVVLVVSAIYWTDDVATALKGEATAPGLVKAVYDKNCDQMLDIIELVRGELTSMTRLTLSALVTMDVHARDVLKMLDATKVTDVNDFSWTSQLRMYFEEETVPVRMMNASIIYGYEYLGNSGRLVVTPLTDRCYRTLMGAIHLNLGGAPEGPAGTGKTETTKDLAKALARQCVVFNCSDTLDYLTMAKFFKGLASSGAWA